MGGRLGGMVLRRTSVYLSYTIVSLGNAHFYAHLVAIHVSALVHTYLHAIFFLTVLRNCNLLC